MDSTDIDKLSKTICSVLLALELNLFLVVNFDSES